MKKTFTAMLIYSLLASLFAFPPIRIELFVDAYVNQLPNIENFVHLEELAGCNRLGISYENVDNKCFISYLLPENLKDAEYQSKITNIDEEYSIAELNFPNQNYQKKLHFKDGHYISPVSFHARNWPIIESEHFRFIVSSDSLINDYSIQNLEKFLSEMMDLLKLNEADRILLKQEKINYVLCRDAAEIENLTGFNTRGIFLLAQDCIVSIFNSHYHELAHLLMNFKLKNMPLYTNPFLQEGFAVAVGGRGGKEPNVILEMGKFLIENSFLGYTKLLSRTDFYSVDASLSYPVSGLYNRFLLEQIGIENYLELYRKYSTSQADNLVINRPELPSNEEWINNLKELELSLIWLEDKSEFQILQDFDNVIVLESNNNYFIKAKNSFLLESADEDFPKYVSTLFMQKFPKQKYAGEKYLIQVSEEEVMIYNLFTNCLIADYSSGFSLDFQLVPHKAGFYQFYVSKDIFDDSLENMIILSNRLNDKE
jgi:hypothetical protein